MQSDCTLPKYFVSQDDGFGIPSHKEIKAALRRGVSEDFEAAFHNGWNLWIDHVAAIAFIFIVSRAPRGKLVFSQCMARSTRGCVPWGRR